jgi:hypothetical protein
MRKETLILKKGPASNGEKVRHFRICSVPWKLLSLEDTAGFMQVSEAAWSSDYGRSIAKKRLGRNLPLDFRQAT